MSRIDITSTPRPTAPRVSPSSSPSTSSPSRPRLAVRTPFTADSPAQRVRLRLVRAIFHNPANNWGVFHFTPVYDPSEDPFVKELCTVKARTHEHSRVACSITGTGIVYFPRMNNIYELEGRTWEDPKFGKQLQFRTSKRLDESAAKSMNKDKDGSDLMNSQSVDLNAEAKKYLRTKYKASTVKEITELVGGPDKLHAALSEKTIPEALISAEKAKELSREYHIFRNFETVSATLADMGISQTYHARIIDEWGPSCVEKVKENPYTLMEIPGFGFKRIDAIVMADDPERKYKYKIAADSSIRIGAAYTATLEEESRQGHTWTPLNILQHKTKKLLNIKVAAAKEFPSPQDDEYRGLFVCVPTGKRDQIRVYNRKTFLAEKKIKDEIKAVIAQMKDYPSVVTFAELESISAIPDDTKSSDITKLNTEQKAAFITAVDTTLSIITGGPGTGKTFLIKSIVDHIGVDECAILAPTGKAAVRITQATGYSASTMHKYLGINIGGQGGNQAGAKEQLGPKGPEDKIAGIASEASHTFSRPSTYTYPDNPAPHNVFIIDEFSMVDVELFAKFLSAIRPFPQSRVILIGDPDQLPSIGPGNVLHDLISLRGEGIPVTTLCEPVRTSKENLIYKNAAYLRDLTHGTRESSTPMIVSEDKEGSEFTWEKLSDPQDMIARVVKVVKAYYEERRGINYDFQMGLAYKKELEEEKEEVYSTTDEATDPLAFENLPQVIIPTNQGAVSVETANKLLQSILNPYGDKIPGTSLRIGDKVMCTQNNYEVDMMNGDVGTIFGYEIPDGEGVTNQPELQVKFFNYGYEHSIPQKFFNKLTPAYAITIHKAQGSEYAEVIVVLHKQHSLMLYRNLFYTAITRAKKHLRLIGSTVAVQTALKTEIPQRRTSMGKYDIFE